MLTYKPLTYGIGVYFDGRRIGMIKTRVGGCYQYVPNAGMKYRGHIFSKLAECKRSLEAHNAQ